jgi:YebC/PmpR family DNA-binding regulatory protein
MSGHSHAKTVAATKNANDAKKGKIYSKYGRLITIAVKEGGGSGDPTTNAKLKTIIEQAKEMNMPKENIERAIKKGTGELVGDNLDEVSFEAFGPGGIALIINAITDNKNRTLGEIKVILNMNNSKLAGEGAVRWMFENKGVIVLDLKLQNTDLQDKENLELLAIEAGAEDIKQEEEVVVIYTGPTNLDIVKKTLEEKQIKIDSASIVLMAKEEVLVSEKEKEQCQKLFNALDDNDAVQDVFFKPKKLILLYIL